MRIGYICFIWFAAGYFFSGGCGHISSELIAWSKSPAPVIGLYDGLTIGIFLARERSEGIIEDGGKADFNFVIHLHGDLFASLLPVW